MIVEKYGITLRRLTKDDIELVRHHRNSDFIRSKMFYQKIITEEEQRKWFTSINNDWNYYYLIEYKGTTVGMVHGTIISYEKRTARGGILIWDEATLNSHLPVIASVLVNDLTFFIMEMETTSAEVRSDNKIAIAYNLSLGYTIVSHASTEEKIIMELTRKNYVKSADKVRNMVKKISKDAVELCWEDIQFPETTPDNLYRNLPEYLNKKMKEIYQNI